MTDKKVDNGVDVEFLLGAREMLAEAPEAAQFKWRAKCDWVNGTPSNTRLERYFGLGAAPNHTAKHQFVPAHH